MSGDARIGRAAALLAEHGFPGGEVTAEGPEREIAAVRLPPGEWEGMMADETAALVSAIRALGFRYVALDLQPAG